jgi:hypothetical protein
MKSRRIFAVLIPHETVNESIRHGGRAKVFDYLFSGRVQLNFPIIASLCIDLTHDLNTLSASIAT